MRTPVELSPAHRLSTGVQLDPAGRSIDVGNMPLGAVASPDGRRLLLSLGGWREQGIEVVDVARGEVVQRLAQPGAFLGLAWSADGTTLYASGGVSDAVYIYAWHATDRRPAALIDSIVLRTDTASPPGSRYAAGLAVSHDGRMLYVAENLSDSLGRRTSLKIEPNRDQNVSAYWRPIPAGEAAPSVIRLHGFFVS